MAGRKPRKFTIATYTGMSADIWRDSDEHVQWAQTDPHYKDVLAVVTNYIAANTLHLSPDATLNVRQTGRMHGMGELFRLLLQLATYPEKRTQAVTPDYSEPLEAAGQEE